METYIAKKVHVKFKRENGQITIKQRVSQGWSPLECLGWVFYLR